MLSCRVCARVLRIQLSPLRACTSSAKKPQPKKDTFDNWLVDDLFVSTASAKMPPKPKSNKPVVGASQNILKDIKYVSDINQLLSIVQKTANLLDERSLQMVVNKLVMHFRRPIDRPIVAQVVFVSFESDMSADVPDTVGHKLEQSALAHASSMTLDIQTAGRLWRSLLAIGHTNGGLFDMLHGCMMQRAHAQSDVCTDTVQHTQHIALIRSILDYMSKHKHTASYTQLSVLLDTWETQLTEQLGSIVSESSNEATHIVLNVFANTHVRGLFGAEDFDDLVMSLVPSMDINQLLWLMNILHTQRLRQWPMLTLAIEHLHMMKQAPSAAGFSFQQCIWLYRLMHRFNMPSAQLFNILHWDVCQLVQADQLNISACKQLLLVFAQLRYTDDHLHRLIDTALAKKLTSSQSTTRPSVSAVNVSSILIGWARGNHEPDSVLVQSLVSGLPECGTELDSQTWLDTFWAMCVLGVTLTREQLQSLLTTTNTLIDSRVQSETVCALNTLKLLNIAGAHADHTTVLQDQVKLWTLSHSFDKSLVWTLKYGKQQQSYQSLVRSLLCAVADNTQMQYNVLTPYGVPIDAVLVLDAEGLPKTETAWTDGDVRVAVLAWHYVHCLIQAHHDTQYIQVHKLLTGQNAFGVRLLESAGYEVLHIYEHELVRHTTQEDQVMYLKGLLTQCASRQHSNT